MKRLRSLTPVLGAAGLLLALGWLHREFARYDLRALLAEVHTIPGRAVLIAALATAASYLLLTLYDALALRHLGHELGYARTAATSFAAYVTSHNVGFGGLGGTAVRYRLYTTFGLSALEIAEVVAFSALGFWLGVLLLAGVTFTWAPVALPGELHALVGTTRPLGVVFLVLSAAALALSLVLKRPLSLRSWNFAPPNARELALLLPLSVLDWALASAVLFALLPGGHGLSYPQVFGVFLVAQACGMLSHVPAGLGVFEALVLQLLPGDLETPELVGVLLVYRGLYYLAPLVLGCALLLGLEASAQRARVAALGRWLAPYGEALVPRALAVTTFLGGSMLLLTGSLPAEGGRMAWLREVIPLPLVELSHFLAALVGAALLILSNALRRRADAGWWCCAVLLALGCVLALVRGLDYEEAALLALVLLLLLPFRRVFTRRTALLRAAQGARWWLAVALVVAGTGLLARLSAHARADARALWWTFAYHEDSPRALRAGLGMLAVVGLYAFVRLVRVQPLSPSAPGARELDEVRAILRGEAETLGHLALVGDKHLLFDERRTAFVMFAVHGTSWIALGDPVGGSEATRRELVWRFTESAELAGARPVFYQVSEERLAWYADAGASLLKLGEEARVDLAAFTLEGGEHKGLRASQKRMLREGLSFSVLEPAEARAALAELEVVSRAWLATRATREKGFSLGSFRPDYVCAARVAVVRRSGRILAFANLLEGAPGGELSVDLMRHVEDAPAGLMDFLFAELLLWGKTRAYRWFSLGMAPLAGLEERRAAPLWNRVASFAFRHGEPFYNFQGLRQYKAKFHPVWRARYLAAPGGLSLPAVLVDVTALISGGVVATLRK